MVRIPHQLCNPEFRFYRICSNGKIPIDKKWVDTNNYPHFAAKILNHQGNYGVCCGYGGLIVIDFDDDEYHNTIKHKLPLTFTIMTAKKRMPHYYYILVGEMIKKKGIDVNNKRVCDIQAFHSGVVGPNSTINGRYYDVVRDINIAHITLTQLKDIFNTSFEDKCPDNKMKVFDDKPQPEQVKKAIKIMKFLKVKQTKETHYQCPFHPMTGGGNLWITPVGKIHCFHCSKHWRNIEQFIDEYSAFKNDFALGKVLKVMMNE